MGPQYVESSKSDFQSLVNLMNPLCNMYFFFLPQCSIEIRQEIVHAMTVHSYLRFHESLSPLPYEQDHVSVLDRDAMS